MSSGAAGKASDAAMNSKDEIDGIRHSTEAGWLLGGSGRELSRAVELAGRISHPRASAWLPAEVPPPSMA